MSKPRSASFRQASAGGAASVSLVRTGLAVLLVVAGAAWVIYYVAAVVDDTKPTWIHDLGDWNFLIGFGVLFLGLMSAASDRTPLGRGRGVVAAMLGCFLVGLAWIVTYYVTSQNANVPLISELGNYNLLVGIGFMATGFIYATRWE